MKRAIILATWLIWRAAAIATAAEPAPVAESWKAEWSNRFADERREWVFTWTATGPVLSGTVVVDGATSPLEGRREGAWLELSWTDAEGRITQVRGVVGGGEWRGTVLSGGGGRMVEYGRVRARPAR